MVVRNSKEKRRPVGRPATTLEGREKQLVSLAVDLAEQQLREGTATSQVISHYLKLGSTREELEQDRLLQENELLRAKVEAMGSMKNIEKLYSEALNAMRTYSGQEPIEYDDND